MAGRFGTGWGDRAPRRFFEDGHWAKPRTWNAKAEKAGVPALVFCASMADVFEDNDDLLEQRYRLWDLIAATPWLVWQLLTKRPENVARLVPYSWMAEQWPANVWVGTSVEDQKRADERVPVLLGIPAPVRFLSCEPLLGAVDVSRWLADVEDCPRCDGSASVPVDGGGMACPDCYDDVNGQGARTVQRIQWVICGGESGRGARPMHVAWARGLRDQCAESGVPFLFKQWGEWAPAPWRVPVADMGDGSLAQWKREAEAVGASHALYTDGRLNELAHKPWSLERSAEGCGPGSTGVVRAGKYEAGRLLDTRAHDGYPTIACPRDTDGDGNCGARACPCCGPLAVRRGA